MSRDWMKVYSDATTLSVADAARFDIELEKRPDDLELRIQRLSYLRNNDLPWSEERVWLTKRHPEVRLGGFGYVAREHEPEAYDAIRAAWEVHLAREPDNLLFVQHASEFFGFGDLERADTLLRRGALAEPTNPMWVSSLAHVFMRRSRRETDEAARSAFALEALTHFERAHRLNPHVHLRHVELVHVAQAAIASRVYERATSAANNLLAECDTYKGWWLHGNSVHHANIVLGQVALAAGDLDEAARRLEAAGKTPGSPQLNSFGPDLELARSLLAGGCTEVVVAYLEDCSRFWKGRAELLRGWVERIRAGEECLLDELDDDDLQDDGPLP